jgi:hypothetical protein
VPRWNITHHGCDDGCPYRGLSGHLTVDGPILCDVCSDPVDPETAHTPHEDDCPVPDVLALDDTPDAKRVRDAYARCDCDLWVHPDCCRHCNPSSGGGRQPRRLDGAGRGNGAAAPDPVQDERQHDGHNGRGRR